MIWLAWLVIIGILWGAWVLVQILLDGVFDWARSRWEVRHHDRLHHDRARCGACPTGTQRRL